MVSARRNVAVQGTVTVLKPQSGCSSRHGGLSASGELEEEVQQLLFNCSFFETMKVGPASLTQCCSGVIAGRSS